MRKAQLKTKVKELRRQLRKRTVATKDAPPSPSPAASVRPALRVVPKITQLDVARAKAKRRQLPTDVKVRTPTAAELISMLSPAKPPPGAVPRDFKGLAMDDALTQTVSWAAQSLMTSYWMEGLQFLGYPYLSELAQRPEYRTINEVIATEMTRKWIDIQAISADDEGEDKTDKIKQLADELERIQARDCFWQIAAIDGYMGRSHLFIETRDSLDEYDELTKPIGTGHPDDEASNGKFAKGSLKRIKVVEPIWTYPTSYNSNDPLRPDWYEPNEWFVMGKPVHRSRLLPFIGRPVPDLLKPAYSFGGLSLSQICKPYVDNWLSTRSSVNQIIHAFSVMVLMTDLSGTMSSTGGNGQNDVYARVDLFNALRDNQGTFVLNKDTEDFKNVSAPLSGLSELQAQAQEHMASVARIPLVKLLGIQPAGLNASSDGEIKTFYDSIHARQESFFRPHLTRIFHFAQRNLWGSVDKALTFKFNDLWAMDERELAEVRKLDAETDDILINGCGALHPEEVRKRVAADPDTPHDGIDVEDVPEPPAMGEEEGNKINLRGTMPLNAAEKPKQDDEPKKDDE